MQYKRILFVGDLRPACNYGAIATTEALLDLIKGKAVDAEIEIIDHRSFTGETPREGFPTYNLSEKLYSKNIIKKSIVQLLKRIGIFKIVKLLLRKKSYNNKGNVPARYDCFFSFAQDIKNDKTWAYEKKMIQWADIIIINGEGNIVNGTDENGYYRIGGRYILYIAYLAKRIFGKPCYIINHTVDPKNRDMVKMIQKVYPLLDGVVVREQLSMKMLEEYGIKNHKYVPDALWSHNFDKDENVAKPTILNRFDFQKNYICIGDSSGIASNFSHVKWDVVKTYSMLIDRLKEQVCDRIIFIDGYNGGNDEINAVIKRNNLLSINLTNCSYHELFFVLKNAKIFISGRWHASIISLMAHTPILLWGSDSHKTEALYREIGYSYEFFDVSSLPLNIDRIVDETKEIISCSHNEIWKQVDKLEKFSFHNVDML